MTDALIHKPKTNFFNTKEDHVKFITFWKSISSSKKATLEDHILYTILKGNDFKKAFTPVTNKNKLTCSYNGNQYYLLALGCYRLYNVFRNSKIMNTSYSGLNDSWVLILNDDTKEKLHILLNKDYSFTKLTGIE